MNLKRFILPIAALVMLLAPGIASAQCWYFYCDAYAYWEPGYNQVQGYARISDWYGWGVPVAVDAEIETPNGSWWQGFQEGWAEVVVDVYYSVQKRGAHYVWSTGYYWWGSPGWYWYDGESRSGPAWVIFYPEGEFNVAAQQSSSYGALFLVQLTPTDWDYNGGWLSEDVSGFYDSCKALDPTGPDNYGPTSYGTTIYASGQYSDHISGPAPWVDYFSMKILYDGFPSCGWSASQTVSFDYVGFGGTKMIGLDLDEASVTVYRGGDSYPIGWPQ
jgi:hypothetical protein